MFPTLKMLARFVIPSFNKVSQEVTDATYLLGHCKAMVFLKPIFKSFLGLRLRTGCLIFGYTQLVVLIVVTIIIIIIQQRIDEFIKNTLRIIQPALDYADDLTARGGVTGVRYHVPSGVYDHMERTRVATVASVLEPIYYLRALNIIAMTLVIVMDCFTVALLAGLHIRHRMVVKVFLIYSGVSLLLSVLLFTLGIILLTVFDIYARINGHFSVPPIHEVVIAGVVCSAPQVVLFLLVSSWYNENDKTLNGEERPHVLTP